MTREQVLTNARFSGMVKRYHTWLTHQIQTNAEHTWQVARIYWSIWGPLPSDVSTYILWHDSGELVLGDLPFPVKANNPHLKAECDVVELRALEGMGATLPVLGDKEKCRVKICDLIEMFEFGTIELGLGNTFALPIINDTKSALVALAEKLDEGDRVAIWKYMAPV